MRGNFRQILLSIAAFCAFLSYSEAQEQEPKIIQFTGVVLGEDSISGIGGVHIYVPKAGRGSTTNPYGFFSMPVIVGDSVVFSAVGYQRQSFVIPDDRGDKVTVIVELMSDTTLLPEIEIFPYPTEELFKKAILAYEIPYQDDLDRMERNLGESLLRRMYGNEPMTAGGNHRYFMDSYHQQYPNKFQPPPISVLNPFAWSQFIKSIKRGDLKRK